MKLAAILRQTKHELSLHYYDHTPAQIARQQALKAEMLRQAGSVLDSAGLACAVPSAQSV